MKMTKVIWLVMLVLLAVSCSRVPAGHVGVKVYLLGGDKGVESEELRVGRYWIGMNEELYLFPTFQQNYVWTKDDREGSENNEQLVFQTQEGLEVTGDIGISYHIDPTKVNTIFQKYRKGVEEITDIYLRNHVRDALNTHASTMSVDYIYGKGKTDLIQKVQDTVKDSNKDLGIIVDKVYLIGSFRLPKKVVESINAKIEATQKALQRENEIQAESAEANKRREKAKGEADAILTVARAQAKANNILAKSLTRALVEYKKIEKWNGVVSKYTSGKGGGMLLSIKDE
jgi:regulator of protease activity HflC (stomatin/prohibitin superfamily)